MRARLSAAFLLIAILVVGGPVARAPRAAAPAPWEVAIVFAGADEPAEYQQDVDQNMLELARVSAGANLRLSLYRELPDHAVQYVPDPASRRLHRWEPLFWKAPAAGIQVPGAMSVQSRPAGERTILLAQDRLRAFLAGAFRNPAARRILILYGHGEGYEGLRAVKLAELRKQLEGALPARAGKPLDLMWLDACFMATVEVAYELRGLSRYFMASEDAEFSAGAPFESLDLLADGPSDTAGVAAELAARFIESYSFLREGSQRRAVFSSSATISLLDTGKLDGLVSSLSSLSRALQGQLTPEARAALKRSVGKRRMDREELADLGSLLQAVRKQKLLSEGAKDQAKAVLSLLELGRPARLRSNPRIALRPPKDDSLVVFGYEGWTQGHKGDQDALDKLPANLKPAGFIAGFGGREWPFRGVHRRLYVSPFAPGLSRFHFFFADPSTHQALSSAETYSRTSDFFVFTSQSSANPVLFTGYTQGVAAAAERYSGLTILDPSQGDASPDYGDTQFAGASGWGGL